MTLDIITREQWGSRYPDGFTDAPVPAREVWLHHSVTPAPDDDPAAERAAVRELERIGQRRFAGGISYTFVVPPSGRVYEGHSVHRQGAHTGGRNDVSRAVCLIGNYETDRPTDAQLDAVAALLAHGHAAGWWTAPALTGGHRDAPGASTACPGRHALARIDDINRRAAGGAAAPEGDDMPSSNEVAEAVWNHWIYNRRLKRREYAETLLGSSEDRIVRQQIAPLRGEVAAIRKLVEQIADGREVDVDAIEQAAHDGTARALADDVVDGVVEGTVDVRFTNTEGGDE